MSTTLTLDLFGDVSAPPPPSPAPLPPASALDEAYLGLVRAVAYHDSGAVALHAGGSILPTRCARLVNAILRRVASDRPAVTVERVEEAIAHVGGYYQELRRVPGGREMLWADVRGEVEDR